MTDRAARRRAAKKASRSAANIPSGTVTFLFTDIEGSTTMWEDYPDQMQEALARHDQIIRGAIEARGGYVFKMIGDACCAAFGNAREALEATLAAQRALFAEDWHEGTPIRVRMALHTGVPEEKDGDYFGPPVNRVARLLSAGHGGQILLSAVTYGLVRDVLRHMEPGAELRDLGEYRLRDLRYTERISQLIVPDLPSDFPPPKGELISGGSVPDNRQAPPATGSQERRSTPPFTPPRPQEDITTPQEGEKGEEHAAGVAPPAPLPPREDRYVRKRTIGSGGMAEVYLAHDEVLDRDVALKVLRSQYADDERLVERFRREARNAASLSHPNIVAVHDRGETEDGAYYIVMEYMPGGTLKDRIEKEGPLPPAVATTLGLQIARALEAAHRRGIIHRDIKPQNVLLTEEGEAKVADFGIARAASSATVTKTGSVMGTAHYLSPEQVLGQPASPKSDLYSLGVVLYEMLTGELPYDAETSMGIAMKHVSGELRPPKEVNPNVPEGINAIAMRLLARDPEERYGSAAEVVEALERVGRQETPVVGAGGPQAGVPMGSSTPPATLPAPPPAEAAPPEVHEPPAEQRPSAQRSSSPRAGGQEGSEAPTVSQPAGRVSPDGEPSGEPRRRMHPLAWVLGMVVVVGLGIAAWLLVPDPQGDGADSGGGNLVPVPSLVGQELAAARQEVGEDFDLVTSSENSNEPNGTILEQRPPEGEEVERGTEISVVVSSGPEMAVVPDVVGQSREEAEETLSSEGFEVRVDTQESSEENDGRVVDQSPSGGEAQRGSEVTITVGEAPAPEQPPEPAPGYKIVWDPTRSLAMEVPSDWEVATGDASESPPGVSTRSQGDLLQGWSDFAGEEITSSITTSPDIDTLYSPGSVVPGAYVVASRTLAQTYTNDELIYSGLFEGMAYNCQDGGADDFDRPPLSGQMQTWITCRGRDVTNILVAAAPEGRECVIFLQIRTVSEADQEAVEHMLQTVRVDCGGIASAEDQGTVELASVDGRTQARGGVPASRG